MSSERQTWDAGAQRDVSGSESGLASPPSEPRKSSAEKDLIAALLEHTQSLMQHTATLHEMNHLLGQIVAQNADMLAHLSNEDGDESVERDLMGNRVA